MRWQTLDYVTAAINGHAPLTDWIAAQFPGNALTVLQGTGVPTKANDYPFVALALPEEKRRGDVVRRHQEMAIAYGVNNTHFTGSVSDGAKQLADFGELLINALMADQSLGQDDLYLESDMDSFADLTLHHPLYRAELDIKLIIAD